MTGQLLFHLRHLIRSDVFRLRLALHFPGQRILRPVSPAPRTGTMTSLSSTRQIPFPQRPAAHIPDLAHLFQHANSFLFESFESSHLISLRIGQYILLSYTSAKKENPQFSPLLCRTPYFESLIALESAVCYCALVERIFLLGGSV